MYELTLPSGPRYVMAGLKEKIPASRCPEERKQKNQRRPYLFKRQVKYLQKTTKYYTNILKARVAHHVEVLRPREVTCILLRNTGTHCRHGICIVVFAETLTRDLNTNKSAPREIDRLHIDNPGTPPTPPLAGSQFKEEGGGGRGGRRGRGGEERLDRAIYFYVAETPLGSKTTR